MTPKIVDRAERRKEIGLVALDHFAQNGFAATSMSLVANAAGVGKGTIYEYFKSKEELIGFSMELYVEMIEEEVATMQSPAADPRERLRQYVQAVMESFMGDPRTLGILLSIFQMLILEQGEAERDDLLRGMFRRARQTIAAIITEGVSQGMFRLESEGEAEVIAINLIAFLDGIWLHSLINPGGIDLHAQVRHYLSNLFQAIDKSGSPEP